MADYEDISSERDGAILRITVELARQGSTPTATRLATN